MEPLLKAVEIAKEFGDLKILKNISFQLHAGESIAIMGPSGEGKSTLLQILGTLDTPSKGAVSIMNQLVTTHNAPKMRNRHIGFVFQAFHLLEEYSVLQNVLMPAVIAGERDFKKRSMAEELLHRLKLSVDFHTPTKWLSGGEKQRVALARALCNDPQMILADEPTGNLDHESATIIHQLLLECSRKFNKGLIVVTHNPVLASSCDKTLYLRSGFLETS